ncbi:signal transduction histidine kinase [Sphingomonas kaistensis]|uniref:histidine kinase n=1 Tax=Sphingomonas kaistensis TaxID=298708 RepID=A0A7X5YAW6_9SPHN|nr:HAMP domain-containing sensor histidine kinase [Sphingomonas kaistensis]NJC06761.1 signal transduction histidine kinase [Sphingomonas kaistensis]
MASLPVQPPISARVDAAGRLVAADPPLLALQEQAGSRLGGSLSVPQLAALARLAARLGVGITRPVMAASEDEDLDLLVRAEPDRDGVTLSIERWTVRPQARSRWLGGGRGGEEAEAEVRAAAEDVVTDHALRILSVSPGLARRVGQDEAELTGQALSRLVRPVEDEDGNLPLLEALAGRTAFADQMALLRGDEASVLIDGEPRLEEGRFVGYTIRVRAPDGAAARKGSDLPPLDELLRDPLASIISQAEEIAARSQGPLRTDYAGYGADIATAARHLLELLTALGDGASGASDPGAGTGEVLDLAELVLDAASLLQADASSRRILLDVGGEGSVQARGQPRAITQILVNLIGNAVRFSPEGGTVALQLERGAKAAITVSDQGPGVAAADRVRIFERFEQGAEARGGTAGLGLAISRRLARDMGGEVELLDLPGPGAAFRLTLPLA